MGVSLVSTSPHTLEVVLTQLVSLPEVLPQLMEFGERQMQTTFFLLMLPAFVSLHSLPVSDILPLSHFLLL